MHVLSTPPAFVLSQDQTLRKENLRTNRGKPDGSEFDADKIDCLLTICLIQRNRSVRRQDELIFWHLTLCTLLSSQGSDALVLSLPGQRRGNFSIITTSRRVSIRHAVRSSTPTGLSVEFRIVATCLGYTLRSDCQVGVSRWPAAVAAVRALRTFIVEVDCHHTRVSAQHANCVVPDGEEVVPLDPLASRLCVFGVTGRNITWTAGPRHKTRASRACLPVFPRKTRTGALGPPFIALPCLMGRCAASHAGVDAGQCLLPAA